MMKLLYRLGLMGGVESYCVRPWQRHRDSVVPPDGHVTSALIARRLLVLLALLLARPPIIDQHHLRYDTTY
jgi:hypothetical protein